MAHPIDPVRIQSDELLMARLFARTREETSHFHGFLFYSMRVARGFEEVYTRQLGAPPPGLDPGALQAASQYASARLDYPQIDQMRQGLDHHADVTAVLASLGAPGALAAANAALAAETARADRVEAENRGLRAAAAAGQAGADAATLAGLAQARADLAARAAELALVITERDRLRTDLAAATGQLTGARTAAAQTRGAVAALMTSLTAELARIRALPNAATGLTPAERGDIARVLALVEAGPAAGGGAPQAEVDNLNQQIATRQAEIDRLRAAEPPAALAQRVLDLLDPAGYGSSITRDGKLTERIGAIDAIDAADTLAPLKDALRGVNRRCYMWHCAKTVSMTTYKLGADRLVPTAVRAHAGLEAAENEALKRLHMQVYGTADPAAGDTLVESQKRGFRAATANRHQLAKGSAATGEYGWERRALYTAATDRNRPLHLLDSYATYTAATMAIAHGTMELALCCMEMIDNHVTTCIGEADKRLITTIVLTCKHRLTVGLQSMNTEVGHILFATPVEMEDVALAHAMGLMQGILWRVLLQYVERVPAIAPPDYDPLRANADRRELDMAITNFTLYCMFRDDPVGLAASPAWRPCDKATLRRLGFREATDADGNELSLWAHVNAA